MFLSWLQPFSKIGRRHGAPRAIADLCTAVEENSLTPEVEDLLAWLPSEAFVGRRVNPETQPICKILVEKFHSLGTNCEFGFVQRLFGAEPLDLFRFGEALSIGELARAFEAHFTELTQPENVTVDFDGQLADGVPQLGVNVALYRFRFHGGNLPSFKDLQEIKAFQIRRINLLVRKLIDDLAEGERIFVCKCEASLPEMHHLYDVMRSLGPITLLWVGRAEPGKPAGMVERIKAGFLRGYIGRFAPKERIWDFDRNIWLKLCCESYRMHLQSRLPLAQDAAEAVPDSRDAREMHL